MSLQLKSATRSLLPLLRLAKATGPGGIGVLLSIAVHAALLASGLRTGISFAALDASAQQQEAENSIVPVVRLTPADRNRLPDFAQPRKPPNLPTALALPPRLPGAPSGNLSSGRISLPSRQMPSETLERSTGSRSRAAQSARPTTPNRMTISLPTVSPQQRIPTASGGSAASVYVPPLASPPAPGSGSTTPFQAPAEPSGSGSAARSTQGESSDQASARTVQDILDGLQSRSADPGTVAVVPEGAGSNVTEGEPQSAGGDSNSDGTSSSGAGESNAAVPVEIPTDEIALANAQGDPTRLLEGYRYDDSNTSQEAAAENSQQWAAKLVQEKGEMATAAAQLTIDSNFKGCLDNLPNAGLIGVVVNPDGSLENLNVLRSTGYDVLNRQAVDAVEYADFGELSAPTQYEVTVDVAYDAENCIQSLPTAPESP